MNQPPIITIVNSATFAAGEAGSFAVTTTGFPVATISVVGSLPPGLSLVDNKNGTATLKGQLPHHNKIYTFIISATNGLSPTAFLLFTLTVN